MLLFVMAGYERTQVAPMGLSGVVLKANLVDHAAVVTVDQFAVKPTDIAVKSSSSAGGGDNGDSAIAEAPIRVGSSWRRSYASRESVYGLMSAPQRQAQQHADQLLQGRQTSGSVKELNGKINGIKHDECAGNIPDQHDPCPIKEVSDLMTTVKVEVVRDRAADATSNSKAP